MEKTVKLRKHSSSKPVDWLTPDHQQKQLLVALAEQIALVSDAQELSAVLFNVVRPVLHFYDAAVILRQPDGLHYRHMAIYAEQQLQQPPANEGRGWITPLAGSPHTHFFAANPPIPWLIDLKEWADQFPDHWETLAGQRLGFQQRFWLPLRLPGQPVLGILEFVSNQPGFFTEHHIPLAQAIADLFALAVGNILVNEQIRAREHEQAWQLDIATILLDSLERTKLGPALADKINQAVSCHYVELYFGHEPNRPDITWQLSRHASENFTWLVAPRADSTSPAGFALTDTEANVYVGIAMDDLLAAQPHAARLHGQLSLWSLLKLTLPPTLYGAGAYLVLGHRTPYAYGLDDVRRLNLLQPQLRLALNNWAAFEQITALSQRLAQDRRYLSEEIKRVYNPEEMVGTGPALRQVLELVELVAPTDATVLITGETGTGKELIARALHQKSSRREHMLVKVNCAALPPQLIESELFGHEKGAFTGATERRIGKFELADRGTIFLDEIGELPLELQAKLLRVLQGQEVERVGGRTPLNVNFRVVAATNRDLQLEVATGRFRADLYYRLSTFPLHVPPLRERSEDIPLLADFFARRFARKMGRPYSGIQTTALHELLQYAWPGNIRELENVVEQAVIVCQGGPLRWARALTSSAPALVASAAVSGGVNQFIGPQAELERQRVLTVLRETKGKITGPQGAAYQLGVAPNTLRTMEREFLLDLLHQANGRIRGKQGAATALGIKPTTLEARLKKLGLSGHPASKRP